MLAPGRCLFTTGINTHSNQRKSEAQISNSCKSLVADMGKRSSAPNFEITNMSISEHEGYRRALCEQERRQTIALLVSQDNSLLSRRQFHTLWINQSITCYWSIDCLLFGEYVCCPNWKMMLHLHESLSFPHFFLCIIDFYVDFWGPKNHSLEII